MQLVVAIGSKAIGSNSTGGTTSTISDIAAELGGAPGKGQHWGGGTSGCFLEADMGSYSIHSDVTLLRLEVYLQQ
jgi:hypothetical protein